MTVEQLARNRMAKAIASGRLVRPSTCSACGKTGMIEGHHRDYSKPLDVTWLCRRCHMAEDGRLDAIHSKEHYERMKSIPKPCSRCTRLSKPLRRGRCHPCNEYLRRRGKERPYINDGRVERGQLRLPLGKETS